MEMAELGPVKEDKRILCKYGENCYQKNLAHHTKFKHPPRNEQKVDEVKRRKHHNIETKRRKFRDDSCTTVSTDETNQKSEDVNGNADSVSKECQKILEEDLLPPSPQTLQENIKQKFLVEMPEDFYSFWEFSKSLNPSHPQDAFKDFGLRLVGPFDVLSGKIKTLTPRTQSTYLRHYRYYFDPPEFLTVIAGDSETQFHLGYFRDSPDDLPSFVAGNEAKNGCIIKPYGENLFGALKTFLDDIKSKRAVNQQQSILLSLKSWADKFKYSLEKEGAKMRARKKNIVTKCFHGAGIVVPYNKKTEAGYRPLPESDGNLKKILSKIRAAKSEEEKDQAFEPIQEIITLVQFANDERDYGMGLELGLNLFCFGDPYLHSSVLALLPLAYELLGRPKFAQIVKAHLEHRLKTIETC